MNKKTLETAQKLKEEFDFSSLDELIDRAVGALYVWSRSCSKKVVFKNNKVARAKLLKLQEVGKLTPFHHTYRCLFCNRWHIGHTKANSGLADLDEVFKNVQIQTGDKKSRRAS